MGFILFYYKVTYQYSCTEVHDLACSDLRGESLALRCKGKSKERFRKVCGVFYSQIWE